MSRQVGQGERNLDPKNDDYWSHSNTSCPDMSDSVYFIPTSNTLMTNLKFYVCQRTNGNLLSTIMKIFLINIFHNVFMEKEMQLPLGKRN